MVPRNRSFIISFSIFFYSYNQQIIKSSISGNSAVPITQLHFFNDNTYSLLCSFRYNYMFCGNHDAAEEAAIMYTMIGSCKLAGDDFRKWTTYFLTHIHEYDNDYSRDLANFLPLRLREKGIL